MRRHVKSAFLGALIAGSSAIGAQAGTILQDSGVFDASIGAFGPIGQTFKAIDSELLSIGFAFSDINPLLANNPVTITLYEGAGLGGTTVASQIVTLPSVLPSTIAAPIFIDFDFSGTNLVIDDAYTVALATTGFKVGVVYGPDQYADGTMLTAGGSPCTAPGGCDLNFRIIGETSTTVPEPAALSLLGGGLLFLGAMRRRKAARAATVTPQRASQP